MSGPIGATGGRPRVSVVMANYQAGDRIVPALRSVLGQTMADLEVIVSDDGSRDDSLVHVRRLMVSDPRIVLVEGENSGPAACRNRALEQARGEWIAIVDADDIVHPERLERLLAAADHFDADIVADDLLLFFEDGTAPRLMLDDTVAGSFAVSAERWVLAGMDGTPALGYLKPLIRASRLGALRYDESLRIGEDYDLVLRLLLAGAAMRVVPEPFYLYRRHSASISHRLAPDDIAAMLARQHALLARSGSLQPGLARAFARRAAQLETGLAYEHLVASIKARRWLEAAGRLWQRPGQIARLWTSFQEKRARRRAPTARALSPLLMLGDAQRMDGHEEVPPYLPTADSKWTAAQFRHVWRELAGRRGIGAVRCLPLDRAGLYAAGFIPEAEVAPLVLPEGAA
jgi:succinoglycan biosynthesis protein ExoO